jgi:co-chaperonin GroES (HSP10)
LKKWGQKMVSEEGRIAGLESDGIEFLEGSILTVDDAGNPVLKPSRYAHKPGTYTYWTPAERGDGSDTPEEPVRGECGWRASRGPQPNNTSGFEATGHRVLLLCEEREEVTKGGIVLTQSVVDKEAAATYKGTVVEIGFDAWSDKSTDFCDVGDVVMVGQYVGKFHVSEKDGKKYRFVSDLDIITPLKS